MAKYREFYDFTAFFLDWNETNPTIPFLSVKFVKLIDDERCGNIFEAIIGTLKAARKSKVVDFEGEFLLKGVHDDVEIKVL